MSDLIYTVCLGQISISVDVGYQEVRMEDWLKSNLIDREAQTESDGWRYIHLQDSRVTWGHVHT